MENFILHILKINLLAAVCIIFVTLLSRFVKSRYSSFWRYLIWLIIAVFLLIPVNPVKENHVVTLEVSQNEYQFNTRYPGENTTAAPARTSPENYDKSKTIIKPGESAISKNNAHKPLLTPSEALNFFFILWIAGGIFFLFFKISAYLFSLSNLKRWGIPEKNSKICDLYDSICFEHHIKNPPSLMTHFHLQSPVLAGLKNTCLYLPDASYSDKELELIFAHELCHYRRRDLWYKMLLLTVNTLYWFNPLLYFMTKEAEKDVEYLCDSQVISNRSQADCTIYNRLLLKTAAGNRYSHYLSAGLNDNTADFKERIQYMLKAKTLKKGIIPVALIALVLLLSNLMLGCMVDSTPAPIEIPSIEKITSVQLGSFKMEAQEYEGTSSNLSTLIRYLKQAEPLDKKSAEALHRNEDYTQPVIFRYEDNTVDKFYFFMQDDTYYVETDEGHFYKNNAFDDIISLPDPADMAKDTTIEDDENGKVTISPEDAAYLKQQLKLEKQFDVLDTRFYFTNSVWNRTRYTADASVEESSIRDVRTKMIAEEKQYQYALASGYEVSDEELKDYMENNIIGIMRDDETIQKIFEEAGTTYEQHIEKHRENIRQMICIGKMYEALKKEFRDGNDTINGKEYWSFQDYYNGFLMEILYPEMEDYDLSDFMKELDEAETFYRKHPYTESE